MLQLDQIKFSVQTDELDLASKKIEALGTSLSSLTGNLSKLEKASASAAKTQAEANLINAKAEAIADKTVKANEQQVKSTEAVTEATRKRQSVEERQAAITRIMSEGFSRGQSSILATAEALGEATERTAEYLKTQRAMQGVSPFDKSLGAATVFANELRVMTVANDIYAKGLGFTGTQLQELGREHVRLTEQFKVQGKDLKGLDAEFNNIVTSAKQVTDAENSMALSMKQADKASSDAGKANNFLAREMQRVDAVLTGFNDNLNVTSSNRLLKFREQLKLSGVDAATAEKMLKTYEERLRTINSTNQSKAKNSREEELRYLARATSVQLGDIGISLAGGQNPLLVLIQQGDQLRGVLNQVGASGNEMQRALSMAFSQIVNGSKDVVMALGSFVVGAFTDSAKAVARFGSDILGVTYAVDSLKARKFAEWAAEGEAGFAKISKAMKVSEIAMSAVGAGLGAMTAFAVASAIALLQVTNANDKLSVSLVATGAQLGFTTEYAQSLATTLSGMGATRVDVLNTFSEIAKSGNIASESFLQVAEAALAIERVGGPAIKETVKLFGDLKEKSVETLTKYAEQTGLVTVAQIAYVAELVNAGKEITATTEATNILTAAIKEQADITYASLSSMGKLWVDLKSGINNTWGALQDFAVSGDTILKPLIFTFDTLLLVLTNVAFVLTSLIRIPVAIATTMLSAASAMKDFATGTLSAKEALNSVKSSVMGIYDTEKDRVATYKELTDKINQEGKYSKENAKIAADAAAELRKTNAEAAMGLERRTKAEKKLKEDLEKLDAKTLTKQQFIAKAIEDQNKAFGERNKLTAKNLLDIEKIAAAEWDKANKPKKEKKQPKSSAMKGAEDDASWYRKSIERIDDLKNKTIGAVEQLSKAQILLMDLGDDDSFKKLSAQQQMRLVDRINEVDLIEKQLDIQKELAKAEKEVGKIREENTKFLTKEKEDQTKILQETSLKLELLGKTADEQFVITEQHDLQNKLLAAGLRFEAQRLKLKQDYAKLENKDEFNTHTMEFELDRINQQWASTRDSLMQASADKFQIMYSEKILSVGKNLSDAITTALFEGGQAGTKKLKDYIVGIFREKINVQINAVVNSVLGVGGGNSGGSGGIMSSVSSMFSGNGILGSIGSAIGGFGSTLATGFMNTLSGSGMIAGLQSAGAMIGNGFVSQGLGMAAGSLGPIVGGALLLKDLMSYKVDDKGGGLTATIGGANGLPSGSVGRFREFQQTGGLGGGGTTTNRDWSVADQGTTDYIKNNVLLITEANKAYGKSIGLTSDSIGNFTKSIEINTTGMDAAAAQAAIDAELLKFSTEQIAATYGDAIKSVALEGETTAETLKRLGTDLTGINSMFSTLGYTLYDVSVTGASAASSLASAFGGLAAAQQQLSGYYENFYSQEEQQSNIYSSVQSELQAAGINYSVDQLRAASRGDIRSAVEGIRGSGTDAQVAAAVKAANKLAGLKSETTPTGPNGPQQFTSEYYKPGGEANASSGGGAAGEKAADSIANAWQSIVDSIWGEVKRIRDLIRGTGQDALALAKAEFEKATELARGGDQEAAKAIPALSQTLLALAQGQASTLIELRRAQALTSNSMEQTVTQLANNYGLTVPAFAGGGNYSGGMALVGEQGPELINFNQGGYVHNAGQTASMLGGSDALISEIRRLNSKVEQLEAAAISTAISNTKLLKLFERVTPNGTSIEISGTVTTI